VAYLITGGSGYIGYALIKELLNQGKNVVVFDKTLDETFDLLNHVKFVRGDVTKLYEIIDTIKNYNVENIVHLAAIHVGDVGIPAVDRSAATNPFDWINVNVLGTLNVFEAARTLDVKKVVYASSIGVLSTGPVEDAPVQPRDLYGWCKAMDEFLGQMYYEKYGLDTIGLRFGLVYGPRKRAGAMWVVDIVRKPALGEPYTLDQYPERVMQWQYVKDCAKAFILALDAERTKHKVFNTCDQPVTLREAAAIVKRFLPEATIEFAPTPDSPKPRKTPLLCDVSRAQNELGYEQTSLEDGFKDFINETRRATGLPEID
jgi:nucleoside-diphosphate-sugar epimerase